MKRTESICLGLLMILLASPVLAQQTVRLTSNHPATVPAVGVSSAPLDMRMSLSIGFSIRNRSSLDALLEQQQDPSSEMYHQPLERGEFEKYFGPTPAEYQSVLNWLKSVGFQVTSGITPKEYIWCYGTVDQVQKAFQTRIVMLSSGAFWNLDDPAVPQEFSGVIESIVGLDNLHALKQQFKSSSNKIGFAPADFATFYSLSPIAAAGVTGSQTRCVALLAISNFLDNALSLFDGTFGLPALVRGTSNFKVIFADGQDPGTNSTETEILNDIEWTHAVAPSAPLSAYIGNETVAGAQDVALLHSLQSAVNDNACGAISISAELCLSRPLDPNNPPTIIQQFNTAYAKAASQMQGIFVSSGDEGTADQVLDPSTMLCMPGTNSTGQIVSELAANPNVTAVGGTQFQPKYDLSSNDAGFALEAVWNLSQGASGGGTSVLFAQPSYQRGPGVPVGGNRDVPDVSLLAGEDATASGKLGPGVFLGIESPIGSGTAILTCCFGGTSVATPMWAGISRLIEQRSGNLVGNLNPELYALGGTAWAGGLRDVIAGNNNFNGVQGFNATLGYDLATGWGTPDITTFVNAFVFSRGLVASGIKGSNTTITSAEIYTPTSRTVGTFSPGGTFVDSRTSYGASPLPDGTLLVFGGCSTALLQRVPGFTTRR
jgi:subtilase family serine protease